MEEVLLKEKKKNKRKGLKTQEKYIDAYRVYYE